MMDFIFKMKNFGRDTWMYKPGMPPAVPTPDLSLLQASRDLAAKWIAGGEGCSAKDAEEMHSEQMVVMLDEVLTNAKTLPGACFVSFHAVFVSLYAVFVLKMVDLQGETLAKLEDM